MLFRGGKLNIIQWYYGVDSLKASSDSFLAVRDVVDAMQDVCKMAMDDIAHIH